jgi:hypothetical protein
MNAPLTLPLPGAAAFLGRLEKRILRDLQDGAEEWSHCVRALTQWEQENLLGHPSEEQLHQHKALTGTLLHLGKLLRAATSESEFPDKTLTGMVEAGVHMLEDKLLLWHDPMSEEESEQVLREAGLA